MSGYPGEQEVLAELDHELDVPCVVRWRFLWFIALARLNVKLDTENTRIAKCHDVTNLAIEEATNAPHGGRDTPRTLLLWSIAKVLSGVSDEDWDLDKETVGWGLRESLVLLLRVLLAFDDMFGEK